MTVESQDDPKPLFCVKCIHHRQHRKGLGLVCDHPDNRRGYDLVTGKTLLAASPIEIRAMAGTFCGPEGKAWEEAEKIQWPVGRLDKRTRLMLLRAQAKELQ